MRVVTIVSLAASAVLGLGALVVAKTVLPNKSQAKGAAAQAQAAGVPVVVAAKDIKYGDKLDASALALVKMPADLAPQGAFSSIPQVLATDKGGPPVALMPVSAREPLLPAKLSGPGARASVAAEVAEGMRAYTIKVTDVSGVGGHALPGDHVDVVLMRDLTPQGDVRTFVSYIVLQNIRVLGIDLNADLNSNKPASPNTATLEVSVEDTQKLSVAAQLGSLSLALRRTGQAELVDASPLRTGDFLIGGGGGQRAMPVRVSAPQRPSAGGYSGILIIEGEPAKRGRRGGRGAATNGAPLPTPQPANPAGPAMQAGMSTLGVG